MKLFLKRWVVTPRELATWNSERGAQSFLLFWEEQDTMGGWHAAVIVGRVGTKR